VVALVESEPSTRSWTVAVAAQAGGIAARSEHGPHVAGVEAPRVAAAGDSSQAATSESRRGGRRRSGPRVLGAIVVPDPERDVAQIRLIA
jgi:hypothetical protein